MSDLPVSTLKQIIWGDDFELDKADPDKLNDNPFPEMILKNQVAAALAKADARTHVVFDWGIPPASDVSSDDEPLYKAPEVVRDDGRNTLAKKMGIVKTTTETDGNGTRWVRGFDASGVLVDTRVLLPDSD
jgi:hypothetical protein